MGIEIRDYMFRGGRSPNPATEGVEQVIANTASAMFTTVPQYAAKGMRWTYNLAHFRTLWMSRNQMLIDYLYTQRPYPSYIEIETTTRCDMACTMCEHTYWDEKPVDMPLLQFNHIIDQFPGLKWIGMTGIGQSFTNTDYPVMLSVLKNRGVYVEIYDNFKHIDGSMSGYLVGIGVERMFVSLDAATPETYVKLKPGSDWDKIVKNVVALDAAKRDMKSYFPELCFHYVVCHDNAHEAVQAVDFIMSLGVDVHMVQYSRMLHDLGTGLVDIDPQLRDAIIARCVALGVSVSWNADVPYVKPPMSTCTAWTMPFIFVDGTVVPCCALNEQNDRAWQREHSLGNVFKQDFHDIWYGGGYRAMVDTLRSGGCPPECSRCPLYAHEECAHDSAGVSR